MTPQARGVLPPDTLEAIRAAQVRAAEAEQELQDVVVQALVDGASLTEVQKATGIAGSTQQRWVREAGVTTAGAKARKDPTARDALLMKRIKRMGEP